MSRCPGVSVVPCLFLGRILWSFHACFCFPHLCSLYLSFDCSSLYVANAALTALSFSLHFLLLFLLCYSLLAVSRLWLHGFLASFLQALSADAGPHQDAWPRVGSLLCLASTSNAPTPWVPVRFTEVQFAMSCWYKWASEANHCQIKDVPHQGKSCKVHVFSWWLFPISEVFLMDFFDILVWSRGKSHSKRNSKRRLCQSIHTSCRSLSLFQVYF